MEGKKMIGRKRKIFTELQREGERGWRREDDFVFKCLEKIDISE